MMEKTTLKALPRDGKIKAKHLRHQKKVPAVLYGHGIKPQSLQVDYSTLLKTYRQAGHSSLVDLDINGKKRTVLIHQIARHPVSDKIDHADFYQVKLDEKIKSDIPLAFVGEAPAVKELGGSLLTNKDKLHVEALPQDLVHEIEVDISNLKTFDDVIDVKDVPTPQRVEVLDDPDETVAIVQPPRSEEELAELEEAVKEDVEAVEVDKKGKEEEEDEQTAEQQDQEDQE